MNLNRILRLVTATTMGGLLLALASLAHADQAVVVDTSFPGTPAGGGPLEYLQGFWGWAIGTAGLFVFFLLIIFIFQKTINPDSPMASQSFKSGMRRLVIGLLFLAGGGTIIANTILGPDAFNKISLPTLDAVDYVPPLTGPEIDAGIDDAARQYGPANGGLNAGNRLSGENTALLGPYNQQLQGTGGSLVIGGNGTNLAGVHEGVLQEAANAAQRCGCKITITSGTDGTHATGSEYTHVNGYKIDLAPSPALNNLVANTSQFTPNETRHDGPGQDWPRFVDRQTGATWVHEYPGVAGRDHWDIVVKK